MIETATGSTGSARWYASAVRDINKKIYKARYLSFSSSRRHSFWFLKTTEHVTEE
jgi:hypothetical protein